MREEEKNQVSDVFDENEDVIRTNSEQSDDTKADEVAVSSADDQGAVDIVEDESTESDDDVAEDDLTAEDSEAQLEFDQMDNVINGKKRKQRKRKKKMSKRGKMIEYVAISCVCVTLLIVVAYFLSMFLGGETPSQGLGNTQLIVDMTDLPYYFGTEGTVDLTTTFPGGANFKMGEGTSKIQGTKLTVSSSDETFTFTYDAPATEEGGAAETKTINAIVKADAVNVSTWADLRRVASEKKVICLQANVQSPPLVGLKRDDHPTIQIYNDVYGNGKTIDVFELACSRAKASSKKFGAPYLPGNGKVWGMDAININNREDGEQILFQDVHVTGNNMSTYGVEDDYEEEEGSAPVADGEAVNGDMYGCPQSTIDSRGVLLFSRYGNIVNIAGSPDEKINVKVKHCLIENGGKVLHLKAVDMDLEGTIVRNAADTAISIQTSANNACYIRSQNNVIANSLTGGILFYCFDGNITESNADATWNTFEVVPGSFLDIYNWKLQDGLAFLPETEDFANIANPIASSEIPKASYNSLKGKDAAGNLYIHFAIIKIRTGGGLPKNDSVVTNYKDIGYSTCMDKTGGGFPIPSIAGAIMKTIDVWGYYDNSNGAVPPGLEIGMKFDESGKMVENFETFYKELREGRVTEKPAA